MITPISIQSGKSSVAQYRTFMCYGDTRTGKCVTGDTRVLGPDGRYERIDDIVKWGRFVTLGVGENERGPLQATLPAQYHDMGVAQVFALELADGRRLRGTPEHPVLTVEHGYVPLSRLVPGDHVVVVDNLPYFGADVPEAWEPKLLGYFLGDGSLTQGSPSFAQLRPDILEDFVGLVALTGDAVTMRKTRSGTTGGRCPQADVVGGRIKQWLADHGAWGRSSRDKFVPEAVFSWAPEYIKGFIRALFDCDGHLVRTRAAGRTIDSIHLALVSTSREMLDGVGHLLRRFNIRTRIRYIKGMLNGVEHGAFELRVATLQGIADFVTLIGISRPNAVEIGAEVGARAVKRYRPDPSDLGDGLRCEPVKTIEAAGEAHVYDLTVLGTHNFLANDMIVHNTRFAGTFPNVVVIADASERGWTTLENMPPEWFYHPGKPPIVLPVSDQAGMILALATVEVWVRNGWVDTVVIDSLTFYAESWYQHELQKMIKAPGSKGVDNRALYGSMANHLSNTRVQIHKWPCHVVWLALAAPADENQPGGPMLTGKSRQRFPAGCDHIFYHRKYEAMGEDNVMLTVYEVQTKGYERYIGGGRDGGKLPNVIPWATFRDVAGFLELPEWAPKEVPAEALTKLMDQSKTPAAAAPAAAAPTADAAAPVIKAPTRSGPPVAGPGKKPPPRIVG